MKRRIIRQKDSFTVTLPKAWVRDNHLESSSEINVDEVEGKLLFSASSLSKDKRSISLQIGTDVESSIRTKIINAYRAGYDLLRVSYSNPSQLKLVSDTVSNMIVGFEILETKDGVCVIENIAEPNIEDFHNLFNKILQIISVQFDNSINNDVWDKEFVSQSLELMRKMQRYDNFCRRAISKRRIVEERISFYWDFFSSIVRSARRIYMFDKYAFESKVKPKKEVIFLLKEAKGLFLLLKDAYIKKDMRVLEQIHELEKDLIYKKGFDVLKKNNGENNILTYYVIDIIRNAYLASSPLHGILMK